MSHITTGLIISPNPKAQEIAGELLNILPAKVVDVSFNENNVSKKQLQPYQCLNQFIAVGGDGACLKAMRIAYEMTKESLPHQQRTLRVFGLNCGHIGALSNDIGNLYDLPKRMKSLTYQMIYPLEIKTTFCEKVMYHAFFNEVILKPYGNITKLHIVWKDSVWNQKNIRGGLMIATKIGENASNACNYTGPEEILPIPDHNFWRMSTVHAMSNDQTCDKPFQALIPADTTVSVDVVNPFEDRNAQLIGDSHYNDGDRALIQKGKVVGRQCDVLFVEKIKVVRATHGVLLARDRCRSE